MKFLHINDKNVASHKELIDTINNYKDEDVFILVYQVGCGPCEATRPEWAKIDSLNDDPIYKNNDNIIVVDIDGAYNKNINVGEVNGYPSMKYIKNGKITEYSGDRTLDAFTHWIETKSGIDVVNLKDSPLKGGKRKRSIKRRSIKRSIKRRSIKRSTKRK